MITIFGYKLILIKVQILYHKYLESTIHYETLCNTLINCIMLNYGSNSFQWILLRECKGLSNMYRVMMLCSVGKLL